MKNFTAIRTICNETSAISAKVVDEFLLNYAAQREGLDKEMDQRLLRFRHVTKELEKSSINFIKAQYIVHRVFRKNGLIKKYLQHAVIKALPGEQRSFLERQAVVPWRYSFSEMISSPDTDFYEMQDVFTGDSYLIYSPSISQILSENRVLLWFNLIGFNGSCWQTYGPVNSFSSFGPDDIFFFATELNPTITTDEDLVADVENSPVPYLMLVSGSRYPVSVHGKDEILQVFAEHSLESLDSSGLKKDFKVAYAEGIYRLSVRHWSEPPHLAQAFYVEEQKKLLLSSLTERGFDALVAKLNKHAFGLEAEPDIRVRLQMLITIKHILRKEIRLNPYEDVFTTEPSPAAQDEMDKLNRLLALALPAINSGQEPDFRALAKEAGVDEETARELLQHSIDRINMLKRKTNNW